MEERKKGMASPTYDDGEEAFHISADDICSIMDAHLGHYDNGQSKPWGRE